VVLTTLVARENMAEIEKHLFAAREASKYLGISLSTLRKIERAGLLVPFRTPGGHRRYDKKMLDEYLQKTRNIHEKSIG
jgi:excisionase family DNA binding protein